ncbi:MAG: hypothetical protein HY280_11465 [Nitrospinae bacterium]|nr:hypothetical protein [Nitrospinota bacterium]
MGIELTNARLAPSLGNGAPLVQKIKPATPSFAEKAVFIAKPHKRIQYQLQLPSQSSAPQTAAGDGSAPTAPASKSAKVVETVDDNPKKDVNAFGVQQEGRQVNHNSTVNYLAQYDAYGRPRMGDSREPYDFAFTKFMVKTSQLAFQKNVSDQSASTQKIVDNFMNGTANVPAAPGNSDVSSPQQKPASPISIKA